MRDGQWNVIGTMSGTSLDGLDLCTVQFTRRKGKWTYHILSSETLPYPEDLKLKLSTAHSLSTEALNLLDSELSEYIGDKIAAHILTTPDVTVDLVGSHGHTIFHNPAEKFTLQIGNQAVLREKAGIKTICNFRVEDVEMGGQGAPLVPIGDLLLFAEYDICLNLGGFANLSATQHHTRHAWDVCPVNIGINHYVQKLGLEFDRDGIIARNHRPNQETLVALSELSFYNQAPPKSLGREWLEEHVYPLTDALTPEVAISTLTHHAAFQLAKTLNSLPGNKVICTGGGAKNTYLIELVSDSANKEIVIPEAEVIDFKEALIFAFLAVLKELGEVNVLSSVTGAPRDHSAGIVYD